MGLWISVEVHARCDARGCKSKSLRQRDVDQDSAIRKLWKLHIREWIINHDRYYCPNCKERALEESAKE